MVFSSQVVLGTHMHEDWVKMHRCYEEYNKSIDPGSFSAQTHKPSQFRYPRRNRLTFNPNGRNNLCSACTQKRCQGRDLAQTVYVDSNKKNLCRAWPKLNNSCNANSMPRRQTEAVSDTPTKKRVNTDPYNGIKLSSVPITGITSIFESAHTITAVVHS